MQVRISKWGNSLGLRLPRALAVEVGIKEGAQVEIAAERDRLIVRPARRWRLEDLLANMTPEAAHEAFDWGEDRGREVIDD
ncbi:MAG: AbrB/MazE/SpoVT family DNA-binding domain-containing protein [Caulobacteraceae bacterium]